MTHLTKEVEFFCIKCDQAICINCKLTEHEYHKTQDLQQAAAKAKIQLSENLARIERRVKLAKKNADDARTELQGIQDKKTELTAVIHKRRDAIVAMVTEAANKYRDEALASLNEMTDHMKIKQEKEVEITQQNLEELTKLQQRVQQAVDNGAGCELVTVAREMRCEHGSEGAVQKLTTKQMTTVCRPVLRFSATHVVTLERMRDYMGSAAKMEMAVSAPEVTVIEQFRCREDPDTDVCHVCPTTDGEVLVSGQLFVVLEEAQAPDLQRTVRLYRRPQPDAIATYSPPVAPFQPSDVCFYTLGGHEVLLVADELNDAIHVVNVQDGRLNFARYLAPGCPLLVQPTALNTDTRGRLWVACRGGRIITCTPITSTTHQ
nr:hypothetical protein BaRGS_011306 [Batillaria attramentaria]